MVTLLCLLTGIAAITAIARYNESDKLFWKLLVSFLGGYAACTFVNHMITSNKEEGKVVVVEEAPTQVLESVPCSFYSLADISLSATLREKSPKPVSKDSSLTINDSTLSEVHVSARGQPFWIGYFDTS